MSTEAVAIYLPKAQSVSKYEHTPLISQRKRALFANSDNTSDSELSSDLGHISPLTLDSESDSEDIGGLSQKDDHSAVQEQHESIGDYDIIGPVESVIEGTPRHNKYNVCSDTTMSPLYLSPFQSNLRDFTNIVIPDTPLKHSPTQTQKTPHDHSSTISKAPRLLHKSLDCNSTIVLGKRKTSPLHSPEHKVPKFDSSHSKSKVRTALFPEVDISLPSRTFYPKDKEKCKLDRSLSSSSEDVLRKHDSKISKLYLCSRKRSSRKYGQINAGVRHRIRKPKSKKYGKSEHINVQLSPEEKEQVKRYLEDVENLKDLTNEIPKQILSENKENIDFNRVPLHTIQHVERNQIRTKENATEKRNRSPSPEPDQNKKFFKFSRHKAVVTMNKNIKLQVEHGKFSLVENTHKKTPKIPIRTIFKFQPEDRKKAIENPDLTDLINGDNDPLIQDSHIGNILEALNDENESSKCQNDDFTSSNVHSVGNINSNVESQTSITLQACNSILASENSIQLHEEPSTNKITHIGLSTDMLLSPTTQMCNMTSGLALNSPKKVKNLIDILCNMPSASCPTDSNIFNDISSVTDMEQQKLFPIFCTGSRVVEKKLTNINKLDAIRPVKKIKSLPQNQMLLDAGQKKFGATQCPECNIVYHMGDPSDEIMHLNYHNAGHVLRFMGWKNERIVTKINSDRIIQIMPTDSKAWWKKVNDLMEVINRDLGYYEMEFDINNSQVYLYIKNRTIAGCAVAVPKTEAHKMLTSVAQEVDLCSEEVYPVRCGVSRIWVSQAYRKLGVATALMNSIKNNFMLGYVLRNEDIALSSPTDMGKKFARNYFKTDSFLIYYQ